MLPDWVSNPGPLTYESGALPIALRGPADIICTVMNKVVCVPFDPRVLPVLNIVC